MEKAAAIGDKVVEAIADTMKPGMTEADLFACAYEALFKNGGELRVAAVDAGIKQYVRFALCST